MRTLLFMLAICLLAACGNSEPDMEKPEKISLTTEAPAPEVNESLPFIHTVFFWEREGLSAEESTELVTGINSLRKVPSVGKVMIGTAAGSENRDVVDHSYDHALIVHFKDQAAHDAYQIDSIHTAFVEAHKDKWSKVVVYDSLVE